MGQNHFQQYLTNGFDSYDNAAYRVNEQFTAYRNSKLSPIKKLEFRSETHDFRLNQQEYSLRLSFNDFLFNKYQAQILIDEELLLCADIKRYHNKILETRYKDVLDFHILKEELLLEVSKLNIIKDLSDVYRLQVQNGAIEPDDITSNKLDEIKVNAKISSLKDQLLNYKLLFWGTDSCPATQLQLPSPDLIVQFIDSSTINTTLLQQVNSVKENLLIHKFRQKNSSENQLLDFFQARYIADPNDLLKEKISLGLGIRIPYINNNTFNKNKLNQSLFELQQEQKQKLEELDHARQQSKRMLNSLHLQIIEYQQGLAQFEDASIPFEKFDLSLSDGIKMLKRNLEIENFRRSLLEIKKDFYKEYISFLSRSGYIRSDFPYYLFHIPFTKL